MLGQSNGDGKGLVSSLATLQPTRWLSTGVYNNLFFWQNDCWDFHTNRGRIARLDLSTYDDAVVAPSSYAYLPNKNYLDTTANVPNTFGGELEIARGFAEELGANTTTGYTPIGIKLCIDATYFSPYEPTTFNLALQDWWWPGKDRTWHPSYPKIPTSPVTLTQVATATITGSSSTTLTAGAAAWVADEHVGRWAKVTWADGHANNVRSTTGFIIDNTGTVLTVGSWRGGTPPTTGTVTIYSGVSNVLGVVTTLETGTATAVTTTTLTLVGAFAGDSYAGKWVSVGGNLGLIASNTDDALTITAWTPASTLGVGISSNVSFTVYDIAWGAGSFSKVLVEDYAQACEDALGGGHQLDIQDVFTVIGESDASDGTRALHAYNNMKAVIHYIRTRLVELDLTTLPAEKIRVTIAKVKPVAAWPYADLVNSAFDQLADNDPYISVVETSSYSYGGTSGSDTQHYDANGQLGLGRALYESNFNLRARESKATVGDKYRLSLSELRTRFRRRYERTTSSAELTNPQVNGYLNDALRHLYNVAGDNAWFLRQIDSVSITGSPGQTTTLPAHIRRVYRVEKTTEPGLDLPNFVVGYSNEGRTQLVLSQHAAGTYNIHHFLYPLDLSADEDMCVVPPEYIELVILYACKRAAETAGNVDHAAIFNAEVAMLEPVMKRDLVRYDRPRKPAVTSRYEAEPFGPVSLRNWERSFDRY